MNWLNIYLNKPIFREARLKSVYVTDKRFLNTSHFLCDKEFDMNRVILSKTDDFTGDIIFTQEINQLKEVYVK